MAVIGAHSNDLTAFSLLISPNSLAAVFSRCLATWNWPFASTVAFAMPHVDHRRCRVGSAASLACLATLALFAAVAG
jgi:hypothetical protein